MTTVQRPRSRSISEPLQQPLDIIELDLRAEALSGAAPQFVENFASFLQGILVGNLDISPVQRAVVRHWPTERIAFDLVSGLAVGGRYIIIIGITAAQGALHLLGEFARRLLQLIERFGLGPDRCARLAPLQRLRRVAHRPFSASERIRDFTEAVAEPSPHFA